MNAELDRSLAELRINFHISLARRTGHTIDPRRVGSLVRRYDDAAAVARPAAPHRRRLDAKLTAASALVVLVPLAITLFAIR